MSPTQEQVDALKQLLAQVAMHINRGDKDTALKMLKQIYEDTHDKDLRKIIVQFGIEAELLEEPREQEREPEPEEQPHAPDPGLPKHPSDMMDDIRRRHKTGIPTRTKKGQEEVFKKTVRETIYGVGSFIVEKVTMGVKGGQKFSDTEHGSVSLVCGCVVNSKNEMAGPCSICNGSPCKNHFYNCFECHRPVCIVHMRNIEDKELCIECYEMFRYEVEELTDTWDTDPTPAPEGFFQSFFGKKDKKQLKDPE